ncbi:hypothetical protein PR048_004189 [Dryococelus australis]|uniref:Uncharacterized protein n=1 Tax=Dryococelus australis TaxID=614101 RepID=A0ABQ9I4U8_9NEOP|nr:hypothetical protein PR048_004189 [Dryococelus australis]
MDSSWLSCSMASLINRTNADTTMDLVARTVAYTEDVRRSPGMLENVPWSMMCHYKYTVCRDRGAYQNCEEKEDLCLENYCPPGFQCDTFQAEDCEGCASQPVCKPFKDN